MALFEKSILIDGAEQDGKCSDDEVPLKARRAAWVAIARSLDSETYARIMPDLDKGDVEELFRRVRVVYYPTHVSSVQSLYEQLRNTRLTDFKDVDMYLKGLKLLFQRLVDQGEAVPEGMCISYILGGLPKPEYNNFMLFASSAKTASEYMSRLLEYARNEPSIPGSLHPQARRAIIQPAHSARDKFTYDKNKKKGKGKGNHGSSPKEDCRNFAEGRCRNGDKCPYRHAQPPTVPSNSTQKSKQGRHCSHCNKDGHTEETCFQKYPDLAAKYKQDRARDQGQSSGGVIDPAHATKSESPGPFRMFHNWSDSAFTATDINHSHK